MKLHAMKILNYAKNMWNKILEFFCVYFMGGILRWNIYRWNINGTYKMNQNMQNGIISESYTDDKKKNILESLIIILSQLKTFIKSFI